MQRVVVVERFKTGVRALVVSDQVPMSKVNWDAKMDSEYINNYKVGWVHSLLACCGGDAFLPLQKSRHAVVCSPRLVVFGRSSMVSHHRFGAIQVLQSAFDRLHIDKHIDVQRLTRGKYMDNLEFMQVCVVF